MKIVRSEGPCSDPPDTYVSVDAVCERFRFSRRSFYRWLALPETGLAEVVVRVPPPRGRIRVPVRRFEEWLRGRG